MSRKIVAAALGAAALLGALCLAWPLSAQKEQRPEPIPHGQSKPPNPALAPAEALKKMTVPPGFHVELVAAEPAIVNPVAMTFDERGRIWITESLEYPRTSAGPGRDRIKVLESTKGDGHYDKITVFAEGLNIPSGIAVGHGGVWVANAPDILFYKEGPDGKAAGKPEVVVTGFGRSDTHELPNSLTWGPDGWLYGFNGVFNHSHVKHRGKDYKFTCALFRIHPRTKDFELFCEGTSNPWGIAFDSRGSAFVSACVIDHLWHLVETGYYHRQGGPYPPYTWKIESIVKHRHQKAAYCGLHFFDSDAYPPEYREKLYMGNIHGNCINCDELTRDGSTYFATPRPDFLSANDAWFMPVAQRTGPDGCLYVLDWYDRYHCYQDARRDPNGIDRQHGRLYRVVYGDYKAAGRFDLGKEDDAKLIERLHSPNIFDRDTAQRILGERLASAKDDFPAGTARRLDLEKLVLDDRAPRKARLHALWALANAMPISGELAKELLDHKDPILRAWGVRLGHERQPFKVLALANDPSPDVKLQVAIAARKLPFVEPVSLLVGVAYNAGDDKLIPHIVWQNLHPLLETKGEEFAKLLGEIDLERSPALAKIVPRAVDRLLASKSGSGAIAALLHSQVEGKAADPNVARHCLTTLAAKVQTGEIAGANLEDLRRLVLPVARKLMDRKDSPLSLDAAVVATVLRDRDAFAAVRQAFASPSQSEGSRYRALEALVAGGDPEVLKEAAAQLSDATAGSVRFRGDVLAALGKLQNAQVADVVLAEYPRMEPDLKPKAIELLTQRAEWSKPLLRAIAQKKVAADALNVNQVRRLLASKDQELVKEVQAHWGTVRDDRNPERENVVEQMRKLLASKRGDPAAGQLVFKKLCAQCHKIYGEGVEVGPDLTGNGRASFEQLLSNVFDPSLVIGAGYQATTVVTNDGQVLTGLLSEDSPQRVVLKLQGGKLETVARADVDSVLRSKVSLMPEQMEKQLSPAEIVDLFAFLTLDGPPGDPRAKLIPGTPR